MSGIRSDLWRIVKELRRVSRLDSTVAADFVRRIQLADGNFISQDALAKVMADLSLRDFPTEDIFGYLDPSNMGYAKKEIIMLGFIPILSASMENKLELCFAAFPWDKLLDKKRVNEEPAQDALRDCKIRIGEEIADLSITKDTFKYFLSTTVSSAFKILSHIYSHLEGESPESFANHVNISYIYSASRVNSLALEFFKDVDTKSIYEFADWCAENAAIVTGFFSTTEGQKEDIRVSTSLISASPREMILEYDEFAIVDCIFELQITWKWPSDDDVLFVVKDSSEDFWDQVRLAKRGDNFSRMIKLRGGTYASKFKRMETHLLYVDDEGREMRSLEETNDFVLSATIGEVDMSTKERNEESSAGAMRIATLKKHTESLEQKKTPVSPKLATKPVIPTGGTHNSEIQKSIPCIRLEKATVSVRFLWESRESKVYLHYRRREEKEWKKAMFTGKDMNKECQVDLMQGVYFFKYVENNVEYLRTNMQTSDLRKHRAIQITLALTPRLPNIYKEGWLVKQGGKIKTWKRRWITLKDGVVTYYKDKDDELPIDYIDIPFTRIMGVGERSPSNKNTFMLPTPYRLYLMKCKDEEEFNAWSAAIQQCAKTRQREAVVFGTDK